MTNEKQKKENTTDELLRDFLIVQLGLAGLAQNQIREIVGGDMHRVNRIAKHFKKINQLLQKKTNTQVEIAKNLHIVTASVVKILENIKKEK